MARLVYLVGAGYSGSTLFAFLANAHSRVASVGEATGPNRRHERGAYRCSCGATLATCAFWKQVGEAMARRGFTFGPDAWDLAFDVGGGRIVRQLAIQSLRSNVLDEARDTLVLGAPGWGARLREIGRRNAAFVDAVLEVTGKSIFLDATKTAPRARLLRRLVDPELRIVHLVRDAPGHVCSQIKNMGASLEAGIRNWKRAVDHALRLEAHVAADRFLRIRYEDLCTNPGEEMARFARFVGVEPEPLPADFRDTDHHIIGNRMRIAGAGEIVLDERWRTMLTADQIDTVLRRTAEHRRRMGFS